MPMPFHEFRLFQISSCVFLAMDSFEINHLAPYLVPCRYVELSDS